MKIVACYNCGSHEHTPYAEENGFALVKCRQCGLLYIRARPDDQIITESTREGRHRGAEYEMDVNVKFNADAVRRYRGILHDLFGSDFGHIKKWLDVGCGHGEFIQTLQTVSHGSITILGCEPNERKQASARSRGLNVTSFDLETHRDRYDAISLLDVYSHLPNPVAFLETLKKLLNPGGELLIETGDCADFAPSDMVRPLCLPDHLSFANERIVVDILNRIGFEVVTIRKYPYLYLDVKTVAKEIVKLVLPGYKSYLRYYLSWTKHSKTNMYVRARMRK